MDLNRVFIRVCYSIQFCKMLHKKRDLVSIYVDIQTVILPLPICYLVLEMAGLIRCTKTYQCWVVNYPAKRIYRGSFKTIQ